MVSQPEIGTLVHKVIDRWPDYSLIIMGLSLFSEYCANYVGSSNMAVYLTKEAVQPGCEQMKGLAPAWLRR